MKSILVILMLALVSLQASAQQEPPAASSMQEPPAASSMQEPPALVASQSSIFEFQFEFASDADRLRYQQLTRQLRCPKCQNNNVSDSDAPIARDIRQRVYQLLNQGFTDEQIVEHMIARYGDFVTYRPPFGWRTAIIWLLPLALILLAGWSAWRVIQTRAKHEVQPLTQAEKAQLSAWLESN